MKKFLIGLLAFGSISTFATEGCNYKLSGNASKAEARMAERVLSSMGYEKSNSANDIHVVFSLYSTWYSTVQEPVITIAGDHKALSKMIRLSDGVKIASASRSTGDLLGYVGLAKDLRQKNILQQTIKALPTCEEYLAM